VYQKLLVSPRGAERKEWLGGIVTSHAGVLLNTAVLEWAFEE
jgi:hypothetical protein